MQDRQTFIGVLALTFGRLVVNMARRFPYPFAPEISRQLSVPVAGIQSLVALTAGLGMFSPLLSPLSERFGAKRAIIVALWAMTLSALLGSFMPQFRLFVVVLFVWSLAKIIYDPAMQAYLGKKIPYRQRGRAIGITELSWAGSLMIIAPLAGYLLGSFGVGAVFIALVIFSAAATVVIALFLPPDEPNTLQTRMITPVDTLRLLRRSPVALAALLYSLLLVTANEIIFINYGLWMERTFNLELTALGLTTIVISAAEIIGEFGVISLVDSVGKRRMALAGAVGAALAYGALPYLAFNLAVALAGLFVLFVAIEIAIVASLPLFTEIMPDARTVMMSSNVAAHSLGRLGGALIGGVLYQASGNFIVVGLVALVTGLAAAFILWRFIAEQADEAESWQTGETG